MASMEAVTTPLSPDESVSVSAGARPSSNAPSVAIGRVSLIPPNGLTGQMAALQKLREERPVEAGELCDRSERMVMCAARGDLLNLKVEHSELRALEHWADGPPAWYVIRMVKAATPEVKGDPKSINRHTLIDR